MTGQELTTVERFEVVKAAYMVNNWHGLPLPDRMTEKDKSKQLMLLRRYLAEGGHGRIVRKYYQKRPKFGRFYAKVSQQGMMREVRHTIAGKLYVDIDMVNAQPTILQQYCDRNGISCPVLTAYVERRDEMILEAMEATEMSRDDVKREIIICMNGGLCFNSPDMASIELPQWVYDLRNEMEVIRNIVFEKEEKVAEMGIESAKEKQARGEWANPKGSTLALFLQNEENTVLMAMRSYLINIGVLEAKKSECVYASDGMQVLRKSLQGFDLDEILAGMTATGIDKTGYRVVMKEKPMDEVIPLPDKLDHGIKETIIEDAENEAGVLFLQEVEDDIRKCQGVVYVRQNGIWSSDPDVVEDFLLDRCLAMNFVKFNEKTGTMVKYSSTIGGASSIIRAAKARLGKTRDFLEQLSNSNRGKIVFEDGYYDFDLREFVEGWEGVMSTIEINRPCPRYRDQRLIDEIHRRVLDVVLGNKKEPFMQFLARAVAGKTDDKAWGVLLGERNSGKGVLGLLIMACLKVYITTICPDSLLCQRLSFGGDEAKRYAWVAAMEFTRLTLTNEIKIDQENSLKIDGNAIKRLSGGSSDKIMIRELYSKARDMTIQSTLLMACNDLPDIAPKDATETLVAFQCPHKFSNDPDMIAEYNHIMPADYTIKSFVAREVVGDAFFHIIMDYYRDEPVTLLKEMKEFREGFSENDEMKVINDAFRVTQNDKDGLLNTEIRQFLKDKKVNMTLNKFNLVMTNRGAKRHHFKKKLWEQMGRRLTRAKKA